MYTLLQSFVQNVLNAQRIIYLCVAIFRKKTAKHCGNRDTPNNVCAVGGSGVPGAPRSLRVEDVTKTSVTLSWEAPDTDGGGQLTGYYVEKRSNYSTRWVPLNRAPITLPTYTARDVSEGSFVHKYLFVDATYQYAKMQKKAVIVDSWVALGI